MQSNTRLPLLRLLSKMRKGEPSLFLLPDGILRERENGQVNTSRKLFFSTLNTPVGTLKLVAGEDGLAAVLWQNDNPYRVHLDQPSHDPHHSILVQTERELSEYFAGRRKTFSVPLAMRGTEFQKRVWKALLEIPFGQTRTYGQLAQRLENPGAMRAVGAANGRNPISILVPCHRVIGASGKLTGFAGGLDAKALLLKLESGANARQLDIFSVLPEPSVTG